MTEINHHQTLVTDQDHEETQSTTSPMDAHNHNLRADTIPIKLHYTTSHQIRHKEAEHHLENDLLISEHTPTISQYTNKTEHHQVTHTDTTTNNVNATNGGAEKKNRELTNCMKKKAVEEQITRKKKKIENAMKNVDAKCNDAPTAWNDVNEQRLTEDHQPQRCKKTYLLKSQNKT